MRAVAGDGVAGALEARIARRVHVQQVARAGPLVAVGGLLRSSRRTRDAVAAEHLPDRRVGLAGGAGDEPRSPAGMAAALADSLLELLVEQPRAAPRPARTVEQPGSRAELLLARLEPPVPPTVGGGGRHAEGGGRRLLRHPIRDRLGQREAAGRSELGSSVSMHPGPPWAVSRRRPTASGEARTSSSRSQAVWAAQLGIRPRQLDREA